MSIRFAAYSSRFLDQEYSLRQIFTNFLAICFMVTFYTCVVAQSSKTVTERPKLADDLLGCDEGVARQDIVVTDALEKLKNDSFLFVIRQGTAELSEKLVKQRLYNIYKYFKERGSRLPAERIMIAVGEPVTGYGRIEYYLDGRLYQKLLYPKNGYVCHSCCGPDENYYPEKEVYERNQKSRNKKRS
jgi:hypothetical protein